MNQKGFSLIEAMFTVAILSVVSYGLLHFYTPVTTFFQHTQTHQQTNIEVRSSLDFMTHALQAAKATSLIISTPTGSVVPNSKIDFIIGTSSPLASGTTAYTFYLTNRSIQMQEFRLPPAVEPGAQTLARNVTGLMFACDSWDNSVVYISLRIDPPADVSGNLLPPLLVINQEVHVGTSP